MGKEKSEKSATDQDRDEPGKPTVANTIPLRLSNDPFPTAKHEGGEDDNDDDDEEDVRLSLVFVFLSAVGDQHDEHIFFFFFLSTVDDIVLLLFCW